MVCERGRTMLKQTHDNRRNNHRVAVEWPVWIRNQNSTFQRSSLVNVCLDGAAVQWNDNRLAGEVHLVVRMTNGQYLTFNAQPTWQSESEVGLKFSPDCGQDRNSLQLQLVYHLARSNVRRRCTVPRARLSRERTVPTGTSKISATSL